MSVYAPAIESTFNVFDFFRTMKWKKEFAKEHPYFFDPCGTLVFTGDQGEGKTLSAAFYLVQTLRAYPYAVFVSNTKIKERPFNAYYKVDKDGIGHIYDLETDTEITSQDIIDGKFEKVTIEYDGLDCLKYVNNGEYGVVYFIDEIHLELNSLESKNINPDIMTELSQQRKQRKHIVGCSQKFNRMAKPLREQFDSVIICSNYFSVFQFNQLIDHKNAKEDNNGKLCATVKKKWFFFHSPEMYERYDTYEKMKRYNKEWKGSSKPQLELPVYVYQERSAKK